MASDNIPIHRMMINILRATFPYLLSHHPHCDRYGNDVFKIGRLRLCKGCYITYPTILLVMVFSCLSGIVHRYPWYSFAGTGMVIGSFEFISLFFDVGGYRMVIKFLLGLGVGLVIVGVYLMPIGIYYSTLIIMMLVVLANLIYMIRWKKFKKKCLACPHEMDWENCPGFREMNERMERYGMD